MIKFLAKSTICYIFNHTKFVKFHPFSCYGARGILKHKPSYVKNVRHNSTSTESLHLKANESSSKKRIFNFLRPLTSNWLTSVFRKLTYPIWSEISRKLTTQFFGYNVTPLFGLVGVTLVSNPDKGLLTSYDECEAMCQGIRDVVSRKDWIHNPVFWNKSTTEKESDLTHQDLLVKNFSFGSVLSQGCNAVVYSVKLKNDLKNCLALKIMFNYEAESNAAAIFSAMKKEMLPAKLINLNGKFESWDKLFSDTQKLPPHKNIVDMPYVFADYFPTLQEGLERFPAALPKRINPNGGFGRNMSLFCVMKQYDCTLEKYLESSDVSMRVSMLLITQLFEAVNHMNKYKIAHRDLKLDNILISLQDGSKAPHLVVCDFGCSVNSLYVPFTSSLYDPRDGNSALMPPEIKTATPGTLVSLNYSKADLWSAASLSYNIFGLKNPFISNDLNSANYEESLLPNLPANVPLQIKQLIHACLQRDPKKRPEPSVAATLCQLTLWAPSKWFNVDFVLSKNKKEIMQWLLNLTTKVICEAGFEPKSDDVMNKPHSDYVNKSHGFDVRYISHGDGVANKPHGVEVGNVSQEFDVMNKLHGNNVTKTHGVNVMNKSHDIDVTNSLRDDAMNDSSAEQCRLEYEILSSFLRRVFYGDVLNAISWYHDRDFVVSRF